MNLVNLRKDYNGVHLNRANLLNNPFEQFELWINDAKKVIKIPNAMSLATCDIIGQVSIRTVLLQYFSQKDGLVFFTNYNSLKARQIKQNNQIALSFNWLELERQVNIIASAKKISKQESTQYFKTRSKTSQLSAWASKQSEVLTSRAELETNYQTISNKFINKSVALPDFWGGYRALPSSIEFWQGRLGRLHDRFIYKKQDNKWIISRLAP